MESNPTLAEVLAQAETLRDLHAKTQAYWNREQMPPAKLQRARNNQQDKLAALLLPILDLMAQSGALSVAVFPEDGSNYSLGFDPDSVCLNGGLQINCTETAEDVKIRSEAQAPTTRN